MKNSKILYHGTNVNPKDFRLTSDYDYEKGNGNVYMTDLPEGCVFLTSDIKEAKCYGKYVIPCELKGDNIKVFEVDTNGPSIAFDDDFCGYGDLGMYSEFVNGAYDALEVRGRGKSTFVTYPEMVLPRIDLIKESRIIKMFENFTSFSKIESDIEDILVELGDSGFKWIISDNIDSKGYIKVIKNGSDLINVHLYRDSDSDNDDDDEDWGYDSGYESTNLFEFSDIYETIMTLIAFMRDKFPDVRLSYNVHVNNNPESDDYMEEFLEENDLEETTIEDVREFTNISSFDIEFEK